MGDGDINQAEEKEMEELRKEIQRAEKALAHLQEVIAIKDSLEKSIEDWKNRLEKIKTGRCDLTQHRNHMAKTKQDIYLLFSASDTDQSATSTATPTFSTSDTGQSSTSTANPTFSTSDTGQIATSTATSTLELGTTFEQFNTQMQPAEPVLEHKTPSSSLKSNHPASSAENRKRKREDSFPDTASDSSDGVVVLEVIPKAQCNYVEVLHFIVDVDGADTFVMATATNIYFGKMPQGSKSKTSTTVHLLKNPTCDGPWKLLKKFSLSGESNTVDVEGVIKKNRLLGLNEKNESLELVFDDQHELTIFQAYKDLRQSLEEWKKDHPASDLVSKNRLSRAFRVDIITEGSEQETENAYLMCTDGFLFALYNPLGGEELLRCKNFKQGTVVDMVESEPNGDMIFITNDGSDLICWRMCEKLCEKEDVPTLIVERLVWDCFKLFKTPDDLSDYNGALVLKPKALKTEKRIVFFNKPESKGDYRLAIHPSYQLKDGTILVGSSTTGTGKDKNLTTHELLLVRPDTSRVKFENLPYDSCDQAQKTSLFVESNEPGQAGLLLLKFDDISKDLEMTRTGQSSVLNELKKNFPKIKPL